MPDLTDPTRATSPNLKRSIFVGLSATAALAPAAALAADDLGKPHPPIVTEDDPALTIDRPALKYALPGGSQRSVESYYAAPKNAGEGTPAIVIAMPIWGVDAQIRDTVRRLAKAGYRTIAPNLYTGLGASNGDAPADIKDFSPLAGKLSDDQIDADLAAAHAYVHAMPGNGKVGVTGFCMGGSMVLRQTVDRPDLFQAAAMWYGKVRYGTTGNSGSITPIALAYVDEIKVPLLGSFGGRDTSIKTDDVRALDRRLKELGKPHDLKVYDEAGHGFFDDTRDSYVPSAATDGWTRTLAWFAKYLH